MIRKVKPMEGGPTPSKTSKRFSIEGHDLILKAIRFADKKHKGQKRKVSGSEYITHPIIVSFIAASMKRSKNLVSLICASILHDTIEDTTATYEQLLGIFGMKIASLVFELTSDPKEIESVGKLEYLKRKMLGMSSYGLFLKLCDRLSNILDAPSEKQIHETISILEFLKRSRKLSKSHKAVIQEIEHAISMKEQ